MKQLAYKYILPFITAFAVGFIIYRALLCTSFINKNVRLEIEMDVQQASEIQFFLEDDDLFKPENMYSEKIDAPAKDLVVSFDIPLVAHAGRLRIDPGFTRGKWLIKRISLKGLYANVDFGPEEIFKEFKPGNDIKEYRLEEKGVYLESNGQDPNIISEFGLKRYGNYLTIKPMIYKLPFVFCLCIAFFIFYVVRKRLSLYLTEEIRPAQIFILIFLLFIFMPMALMNLFNGTNSTGENRELAEQPSFNFEKILEYPTEYTAYFDDNFGFKKFLSTLNSYYKLKLFNASSKPSLVVVGKDSWLYSTDPSVVGDYQNTTFYSDEELGLIKQHLEEAYDWHTSKGIQFYVLMLPIKSNIYPEFLPDRLKRKNERSKMLQLRDYMEAQNSRVKIIDVTDELLKAKTSEDVYYQHDIHLNFQGGFIAYEKLMGEIRKNNKKIWQIPDYKYIKVLRHVHNADLSRVLSLEDILLNDEWQMQRIGKESFKMIEPPIYTSISVLQPTVRSQIKDSKLPRAVVYRDSFFTLLMPYFSETFSDCIYIWSPEMSTEVIEREKPDFVIYEMLESGIDKLLEDNPTGIRK